MKNLIFAFCLMAIGIVSQESVAQDNYNREDIADARFGTKEKQALLQRAYGLAASINEEIFGQETAAQVLQDRLVQYLENFGTRSKEPIHINLIGLPGVGKSALVNKLIESKFTVIHVDAQSYASVDSGHAFVEKLQTALQPYIALGKPIILAVEEIDKVPEVFADSTRQETSTVVGELNRILSEGRLNMRYGEPLVMSNVFVITTMNFSPEEIELFSKAALGQEKSYYDFTVEDFAKFDEWIRTDKSARYKILARLFRSNTVSRLGENTIIMKSLGSDEYREIAELIARRAAIRNTTGPNAGKRVQIEIDPSTIDFLAQETTFAPSGARATVQKSEALIEQLINIGIKAIGPEGTNLDRPRRIRIAVDPETKEAVLTITPRIYRSGEMVDRESFEVKVPFELSSRLFLASTEILATSKPSYPPKPPEKRPENKPITKKEVYQTRFPKIQSQTSGLEDFIAQSLFGQGDTIAVLKDDLDRYLNRQEPAKKEPSLRVLAGFPGIGKSEIVKKVSAHLNLPIARVNMQQFSSDSPDTIRGFLETLYSAVAQAKQASKSGRYILLLEELDKVFEVSPAGEVVNRPIMALVKDILNEGTVSGGAYGNGRLEIDVRDSFVFVTMNFSVDRFGFTADPRMTTIEDVIKAWKSLRSSPMNIKKVLGGMFLPETVNRLMARFTIMKPVDRPSYRKIVDAQVQTVVDERMLDKHGRNVGQVQVVLTQRYKDYLMSETVIPSEGARNTVVDAQKTISRDLSMALDHLPRSPKYAKVPLVITLDFSTAKSQVTASVSLAADKSDVPLRLYEQPVLLKFPTPRMTGPVPPERMLTSAHEFGHAFVAILLGMRIEYIVVVPPNPSVGGYVKFRENGQSAKLMMANVYATLAGRAMERMVLSENPMDPLSVLDITAGASSDIRQATLTLYNMIYELGFDPFGGTVDRNFSMGMGKYASYEDLPSSLAEKLGLILRGMEDHVLADLLAANSKEWYVEKVIKLARLGVMDEKDFYDLLGYKYPGDKGLFYGATTYLRDLFGRALTKAPAEEATARQATRGLQGLTTEENLDRYVETFSDLFIKHLHPELAATTAAAVPIAPAASVVRGGQCLDLFVL